MIKKNVIYVLCGLLSVFVVSSCKPNDAKLQQEVEMAIKAAYPEISAAVKEGVVTLTGEVDSQEIKAAAEAIAKSVKNIKSVANYVTIKAPVVIINPDTEISNVITAALKAGGFEGIQAAVKDGEVTLTGDVKRADLQKVMQIANESKPKKVINELTIK